MENKLVTEKPGKDLTIEDKKWSSLLGDFEKIPSYSLEWIKNNEPNKKFLCLVSTKDAKSPEEILDKHFKVADTYKELSSSSPAYYIRECCEMGQGELYTRESALKAMTEFAQQFQQGTYTREKLIKDIKDAIYNKCDLNDWDKTIETIADSLLGKVGYPNSEWVEGNEPKEMGKYFVLMQSGRIFIDEMRKRGWRDVVKNKVTHYAKINLPSPPINKSLNQSK